MPRQTKKIVVELENEHGEKESFIFPPWGVTKLTKMLTENDLKPGKPLEDQNERGMAEVYSRLLESCISHKVINLDDGVVSCKGCGSQVNTFEVPGDEITNKCPKCDHKLFDYTVDGFQKDEVAKIFKKITEEAGVDQQTGEKMAEQFPGSD